MTDLESKASALAVTRTRALIITPAKPRRRTHALKPARTQGAPHPSAARPRKLFERFRTLTAEEIWTMLHRLTPLEETRAYQSIFVKGEAKGKAEGEAEGVAKRLKRLLARRFGPLPPWAEERIATAQIAQLDTWIDGLLDAESLAALIGPENRR